MRGNPLQSIEYVLPPELTDEVLVGILSEYGDLQGAERRTSARTFLDTFDGRLLREDFVLEALEGENGTRLEWRSVTDGRRLGSGTGPAPAGGFVWDLHPAEFRSALAPLLETRVLLPLVRLRGHSIPLAKRNRDGKLVLQLSLEAYWAAPVGRDEWSPLPRRLCLHPVRGYAKAMSKASARLEAAVGIRKEHDGAPPPSLLQAALTAIGSAPTTYSNKVRVPLRPDQPADEALRQVLLHLLSAMRANEEGTLRGLDTEFLHDFRVAGRRTRSALSQIKDVLPAEIEEHYRAEFGWLGTVTGPARDLDVYLLSFPAFQDMLPGPLRADLDPLQDLLVRRRRQEQQKLTRALRSRRYALLVESWRQGLELGFPRDSPDPTKADRPIFEVASDRLRRAYKRTLREGAAINAESPPEDLHELRKSCKKLRYLLEFFQNLYEPKAIEASVRSLKALQDTLGEYQDLSVQSHYMQGFEDDLRASGADSDVVQRAIAVLVEAFFVRRDVVRSEFHERFEVFSNGRSRALLERALRTGRSIGKGPVA